jgi:argininosuccinate lyase
MKSKDLNQVQGEKFPAAVYAETVLAINFEDAKKYFLSALLEIDFAHTLMLTKQGIISKSDAAALIGALDGIDRTQIDAAVYDGSYEDLFFFVEDIVAGACGVDTAGKMHTARSRNDIDLTLYRMRFRSEVLTIAAEVLQARKVLLELAGEHVDTVMPAYTHTQPAQPTTLAHYLLASIEWLGRDFERLSAAFRTINRNPLGACAITTTAFPIDREYTAELLGFEGLQVNSYGAIASVDYVTEAASAVAVTMINLGKLVQDLLQWCTREYGFLRLSDAYVQCSSIMPQKRNPVALEHTRILASKALGQAQAVMTCTHNTPFGDIVDSEDDLQPLVFSMFTDATRALRLFSGAIGRVTVNRDRLKARAAGSFLTVTELADTLVRSEGLSFRSAHALVSSTVKSLGEQDAPEDIVSELLRLAPQVLGRPLASKRELLLVALDPVNFVQVRGIVGGPAPKTVRAEIERQSNEVEEMQKWVNAKTALLAGYPKQMRDAAEALVSKSSPFPRHASSAKADK